jgi:hypothetical protein
LKVKKNKLENYIQKIEKHTKKLINSSKRQKREKNTKISENIINIPQIQIYYNIFSINITNQTFFNLI